MPLRLAHPGSARRSTSIARTLPSIAEGIGRSGMDRVTDLDSLRLAQVQEPETAEVKREAEEDWGSVI